MAQGHCIMGIMVAVGVIMDEFDMIAKYFQPLTMGHDDLRDDAAVIDVPAGHQLVVTSDSANIGVHVPLAATAKQLAQKALRRNLSDLAAMGADPLCYQLNLAFPKPPKEKWLKSFTAALLEDQETFGIYCSGGDTTSLSGGRIAVSITAMGLVPQGRAVRRGGARDGDYIILSGAIGDAVLGLKALRMGAEDEYESAVVRYFCPQPRNNCAAILREYAHAAIDISDGFIADLGHIARASGLGARVELSKMSFSGEVEDAFSDGIISLGEILSGGDDYEVVMAVSPAHRGVLIDGMRALGLDPQVVGVFSAEVQGVEIYDADGRIVPYAHEGWTHF